MNPSSKPVIHSGKVEELRDRAGSGPVPRPVSDSGEFEESEKGAGMNPSSKPVIHSGEVEELRDRSGVRTGSPNL